jgi:carbamoyltransferase
MAAEAQRLTGCENLCMAGGVALNCVANGKLLRTGIFKNIWIQPAAGDAGGALGAALAAEYIACSGSRNTDNIQDSMNGSYLGPAYDDQDILATLNQYKAPYTQYTSTDTLCDSIAEMIDMGMVVGWYQGRAEFGPRALGNRTIMAELATPPCSRN